MATKFPHTFTILLDQPLADRLDEVSRMSGLSKSNVARQWLRHGRVADLEGAATVTRPKALVQEAVVALTRALALLSGEEEPPHA